MKSKLFVYAIVFIIVFMLLASCQDKSYILPSPIANHIINDVAMSKGINFNTKTQIILNPFTGQKIDPCIPNISSSKIHKDINSNCTVEVINPKDPVVQYIIDNIKAPIPVQVKKGGQVIDENAVAVVTVDVIFKGSHCEASFSSGVKTVNCSSVDMDTCRAYLPYRYKTSFNSATTKQIVVYCEQHFWP